MVVYFLEKIKPRQQLDNAVSNAVATDDSAVTYTNRIESDEGFLNEGKMDIGL